MPHRCPRGVGTGAGDFGGDALGALVGAQGSMGGANAGPTASDGLVPSGRCVGIGFGPDDGEQSGGARSPVFPGAIGGDFRPGLRATWSCGAGFVQLRHLPASPRHGIAVAMRRSWGLGTGAGRDGCGSLERTFFGMGPSASRTRFARGWSHPINLGHGTGLADRSGR